MATATDYLPEAIGGYLRLPRQWADTRPVDRGKTSLMILIDQLDLLAATMDKVFDAVNRADAAALIAHGRFLQEKFGTGSTGGGLAIGPTASTPPPDTGRGPLHHHLDEEGHERRGGHVTAGGTVGRCWPSPLVPGSPEDRLGRRRCRSPRRWRSPLRAHPPTGPGPPGRDDTGLLRRRRTRSALAGRADRSAD